MVFSDRYDPNCGCGNCQAERDAQKLPRRDGPTKLGLLVIAPDDTITGAIVRREGEPWHFEPAAPHAPQHAPGGSRKQRDS